MGSAIAYDMIKCKDVSEVMVADLDEKKLSEFVNKMQSEKLSMKKIDVSNHDSLVELIKGFDVVANALPHRFSVSADKASIEAHVDVVSLSFEDEQMPLANAAERAGITFIPGCGVAPGLTHILAGHGIEQLEKTEEIHMMCGGIPQNPKPPLFYQTVFTMEGTWGLYTKSPRVIVDGQEKVLPPMSGRKKEAFPEPFGELERFYTDGLATLLYTGKGVRNMYESTLRWPGHLDRIQTLIDCGLLENKPINIDGCDVIPRAFLSKLLRPALETGVKDVTLIRTIVSGKKERLNLKYTYDIIDYYDEKNDITSMARTTGYTCSIACQMIGREEIKAKGLVPPEKAFEGELFDRFIDELAKRNIRIQETVTTARYVEK